MEAWRTTVTLTSRARLASRPPRFPLVPLFPPGALLATQWFPSVPVPVSLRRVFPTASFVGRADVVVGDATERSDQCRPGWCFAAIRGKRHDGAQHVAEAIARGATAILVDHPLADVNVPQCVVPDVRSALSQLCQALYLDPSSHLKLAGVTGTNGKTTTSWMIRAICRAAGAQAGVLGTIEYHDGCHASRASLTTPDAKTVTTWLASMVRQGTTHAAMELSSHSLDQRRCGSIRLDAAILTGITQDHFDYHGNFEAYRDAKLKIVSLLKPTGRLLVNVDDAGVCSAWSKLPVNLIGFGFDSEADITVRNVVPTPEGYAAELRLGGEWHPLRLPLIGQHNLSNAMAAAGAAWIMGVSPEIIVTALSSMSAIPGRLESVDMGQPFEVYVDFAHTEDAIGRCVRCVQERTAGRVICVLGAGGDRDRSKRPLMGRAACEAQVVVVTSDNPRTESPQQIIEDILTGCTGGEATVHVEPDRERAIAWALRSARAGDAVLIAGKGHETEQIVGTERIPFDDREIVRKYLLGAESIPRPHSKVASSASTSPSTSHPSSYGGAASSP